MNICHIIWNLDLIGGAERMVVNIAEGITRHGNSNTMSVVSIAGHGRGYFYDRLRSAGISVDYVRPVIPKAYNPFITLRLLRILKNNAPDIIHTHLWGASFHGFLCARWLAKPIVVHEHNVLDKRNRKWYWNVFDRSTFARRSRTIACSDDVRNSLINDLDLRPPTHDNIEIIDNCIDEVQLVADKDRPTVRKELQLDNNDFVFINVASLTEQKAHEHLIKAFVRVAKKHANARLLIVGDGPLRKSIECQIDQADQAGKVLLLGLRSDIPNVLAACDVFVLPSLWEGLPMALLEAMYMKLATIVSKVGAIKSMIENGITGIVIPPGNVDAIYESMNYLIAHNDAVQRIGENGHKLVCQHYTVQKYVRNLLATYKRIVPHHHDAGPAAEKEPHA